MKVDTVVTLLKLAALVVFVSYVVSAGIQIDDLMDGEYAEDDSIAAYCLRFLGEAVLYAGVLYGLAWAVSLLRDMKSKNE